MCRGCTLYTKWMYFKIDRIIFRALVENHFILVATRKAPTTFFIHGSTFKFNLEIFLNTKIKNYID